MILSNIEFDEWLAREETREETVEDISNLYMIENQKRLEIAQGLFPILLLFRIIFLVASFIVVVKLAIKLCSNKSEAPKRDVTGTRRSIETKSDGNPKWYPTGWIFNEETQLWDPPDYIQKEAAEKWRWDSDRQIWVDIEKEERLKRYYEYRKSQGLPPTYEEWKAAKLKEDRKKNQEQEAPAPGAEKQP